MYQFPYTNFHDLDLDWILNKVKENNGNVENLTNTVNTFIEEFSPDGSRYIALVHDVGENIQAGLSGLIRDTNRAKNDANDAADLANEAARNANAAIGITANTFRAQTGGYYNVGAMCVYNGALYIANKVTPSNAFVEEDWNAINTSTKIIQNSQNIAEISDYVYNGRWAVKVEDIEQGYYVRAVKTYNLARLRLRNLYHVKPGMKISYTTGLNLEMTFGTYPYNTQTGEYDVLQQRYPETIPANSTGEYTVEHEGLFVIQFRAPDNTGDTVTINDYDATVNLYFSYINVINDNLTALIETVESNYNALMDKMGTALISANNAEYSISGSNIVLTIRGSINYQYGRINDGKSVTINLMDGETPTSGGSGLYDKMLDFATANPSIAQFIEDGNYYKLIANNVAIAYRHDLNEIVVTRFDYARQDLAKYTILIGHSYTSVPLIGLLADALNETRIQAAELKIANIETDAYPSYFDTENDRIVNEIESLNMNKSIVIAFFTDPHYNGNGNIDMTAKNIEKLNEKYLIDLVICGGDLNSGNVSKPLTMGYHNYVTKSIRKAFNRAIFLTGNHDDNSYISNSNPPSETNYIDKQNQIATFGRFNAIHTNVLYGYNAGYIDYPEINLRIVYLDSVVNGKYGNNNLYYDTQNPSTPTSKNWGYDSTEIEWYTNALTDANTKGYHVITFSHMPANSANMAGSQYFTGSTEIISAINSFINNGGNFVGWFNGHTHRDLIKHDNGFYQISVGTSGCIVNTSETTDTYGTAPARTVGTVTQELWDVVCINTQEKTVNALRYGAGSDVSYTY